MKISSEYVIYAGLKHQLEWYYNCNGNSQPFDYFNELSEEEQEDFLVLVKALGDKGQIRNESKFRNEGDKIYAFKPKPNRFMCFFFEGGKVIVVHAFEKKRQDLPPKEKKLAIKRKTDFINRLEKGEYYEKENNFNNGSHPSRSKKSRKI